MHHEEIENLVWEDDLKPGNNKEKRLSDVLDKKTFERVCRELGGRRIWIPKNGNSGHHDGGYYKNRNRMIKTLNKRGESIQELSAKFNISLKRIYNILNTRDDLEVV